MKKAAGSNQGTDGQVPDIRAGRVRGPVDQIWC